MNKIILICFVLLISLTTQSKETSKSTYIGDGYFISIEGRGKLFNAKREIYETKTIEEIQEIVDRFIPITIKKGEKEIIFLQLTDKDYNIYIHKQKLFKKQDGSVVRKNYKINK